MEWLWITLAVFVGLIVFAPLMLHWYIIRYYLHIVERIYQEKPLFIMPFGKPVPEAEEITLTSSDGAKLKACYIRTPKPRKGVILFGLEFGSNRWSCVPYCEFLREAGYDIFTFEPRGQGDSPALNGYVPLQWVTDFEVTDFRTALAYLKGRADKDPRGVGLFGLSKGGSTGLIVAAEDDFIRCAAVDGIFASVTTVVPYMRQFVMIYTSVPWVAKSLPYWYLRYIGTIGIRRVERTRGCHYPSLEDAMPRFAPRALLMIHGGGDTYIKPDMARAIFALAGEPKELWMVEKAKHNQAFHLAQDEYKKRVLEFFDHHLASIPGDATSATLGPHEAPTLPSTISSNPGRSGFLA